MGQRKQAGANNLSGGTGPHQMALDAEGVRVTGHAKAILLPDEHKAKHCPFSPCPTRRTPTRCGRVRSSPGHAPPHPAPTAAPRSAHPSTLQRARVQQVCAMRCAVAGIVSERGQGKGGRGGCGGRSGCGGCGGCRGESASDARGSTRGGSRTLAGGGVWIGVGAGVKARLRQLPPHVNVCVEIVVLVDPLRGAARAVYVHVRHVDVHLVHVRAQPQPHVAPLRARCPQQPVVVVAEVAHVGPARGLACLMARPKGAGRAHDPDAPQPQPRAHQSFSVRWGCYIVGR